MRRAFIACLLASAALFALAGPATAAPPPIKHVFVIALENKGFDTTFGPNSSAPYLSQTLTSQGQLLTQYYATGHASLCGRAKRDSGSKLRNWNNSSSPPGGWFRWEKSPPRWPTSSIIRWGLSWASPRI